MSSWWGRVAESVALVFAARQRVQDLLGLPELEDTGLGKADAHALLNAAAHTRLERHIRDRIVAETRGTRLRVGAATAS